MMEKIAIYTCIIGGYDELQQPAVVEEGFDFICFVGPGEKTSDRVGVWEIRELAELPGGNPRMASRWPKMHPHLLLPEYEGSGEYQGEKREICRTVRRMADSRIRLLRPASDRDS